MKTTKLFSVISLALIFVGITAGFSKKVEPVSSKIVQSTGIIYRVSIHPDLMTTPCGTYLVQVVDETGRLVAPAQVFVAGINGYSFNEKISTSANLHSRRVAMLIQVKTPSYYTCSTPLFALPDIKIGPFLAGHFYTFDLYPQTKTNSIE
jgi:hypothetical protein